MKNNHNRRLLLTSIDKTVRKVQELHPWPPALSRRAADVLRKAPPAKRTPAPIKAAEAPPEWPAGWGPLRPIDWQNLPPADAVPTPWIDCVCGGRALPVRTNYGVRHTCACGRWSWGGKPPVDRDTHVARAQAHQAFDALWMYRGYARPACYRALQLVMDLTPAECHMAHMTAEQADRVRASVDLVECVLQGLGAHRVFDGQKQMHKRFPPDIQAEADAIIQRRNDGQRRQ